MTEVATAVTAEQVNVGVAGWLEKHRGADN